MSPVPGFDHKNLKPAADSLFARTHLRSRLNNDVVVGAWLQASLPFRRRMQSRPARWLPQGKPQLSIPDRNRRRAAERAGTLELVGLTLLILHVSVARITIL